jgi:DNA-binding transcriptional LysR family regulator
MNLKHLRYFTTLAEELHFGRAAARHNITQSPLSVGIRQLEDELGFRLFQRDSKHVALTPTGMAYLPVALELLNHAERAQRFGHALAEGRAGRLEIGFTSAMVFRGLADMLSTFAARYPDVEYALQEGSSVELKRLIREGRLDVSFINVSDASDTRAARDFDNLVVWRERFIACMPNAHRLARAECIDLAELRDERFIMFARSGAPGHYDHFITMCAEAGFHPRSRLEVRQFLSVAALVGSGLGVSVVPESISQSRMPGVAFVPLKQSPVQPTAYLIWNAHRMTPGLNRFVETVKELLVAPSSTTTMRESDRQSY